MYAILHSLGGLFVDADVLPLKSPAEWLDEAAALGGRRAVAGTRLVVGLEASGSEQEAKQWWWASPTQLTVWAAAAAPGHPVFRRAIDRYVQAKLLPHYALAKAQYDHSLSLGPGLLSSSVDDWLKEREHKSLSGLTCVKEGAQAAVIDDTVVLGIDGFGCGQPHSGSRLCNATASALVQHLFSGAWKRGDGAEVSGSGRRRRSADEDLVDWRLPAIALMAHAKTYGVDLSFEMVRLLFSRIVPIEPPLLPLPLA